MTKQVALSEAAYAALRRAKPAHESFSDAVLRLLRESRVRDPGRFAKFPHRFTLAAAQHLKEVDAGREHDRPDPWADPLAKPGRRRRAGA